MALRAIVATAGLAVAPLAALTGSSAAAPSEAAAMEQCARVEFARVSGDWYIPLPGRWEASGYRCNLKVGDLPGRDGTAFGEPHLAIKAMQRAVRYCYRTPLAVDGLFGTRTEVAVKRVQRAHRIAADGVYGPQTMRAMNWRMYNVRLKVWSQKCYSPF